MADDVRRAPSVVGIGGSTSRSSVTTLLLRRCLELTVARGARTTAFTGPDLAGLPIFAPGEQPPAAAAQALVSAVREADALVIATPGYHGGMSGLVKNALDHLELLREDARPYLDGRAVGVIVAASGWQACGTTLVSVRSAVHALRGWPTPFGVTVNSAETGGEGGEQRVEPRSEGALALLAGQLMDFTAWRAAAGASVR